MSTSKNARVHVWRENSRINQW